MALVLKDRVKETTTTTGTGTVTLAGAVTGYQAFSVIGDANTTYYCIAGGSEWEVGIGTYTSSGTTLSRTTILASSNSGSAVNFSAGTKDVFVVYPAGKAIYGVIDNTKESTAVGFDALSSNTTGVENHAFGWGSLQSNTEGDYNTGAGWGALYSNTTGQNNTAFGDAALYSNTTAGGNTAFGTVALYSNTTGVDNTAVGSFSLYGNTTGFNNAAVGYALIANTTGTGNCAFGHQSLVGNTTGSGNTAIGNDAIFSNTTGDSNTAVGSGALLANTASGNTATGYQALYANTTGVYNTAIGYASGTSITTGSKNVILGSYTGNQGGLDIRTSSNNIVLSDGDGNVRTYIDSSGNVGIGTTSPTNILSLSGQAARKIWMERNTTANTAGSGLTIQSGGATSGATDKNGGSLLLQSGTATGTGSSSITFSTATAGSTGTTDQTVTEKMRINGAGNVGIGTSSPQQQLHLSSASANGIQITYQGVAASRVGVASGGSLTFGLDTSDGATERMRIDSSGNVGVGTANAPSNKDTVTPKLIVNGSGVAGSMQVVRNTTPGGGGGILELTATRGSDANSYTILQSGDGLGSVVFGGADGNEFVVGGSIQCQVDGTPGDNDMPGRLIFNTTADGASSPTERMRIGNDGEVDINCTSVGSAKLRIYQNGNSNDNSYSAIDILKGSNNTTTAQVFQRFFTDGGAAGNGSITANGASAATFTAYSDRRLKENIQDLPPQLENICNLKPVEFDYIGYPQGQGHQIGFIAQDMQQVYSDVVAADGDGMLQIAGWSKTEARLVKAIQELKAELDAAKARIATLEAK